MEKNDFLLKDKVKQIESNFLIKNGWLKIYEYDSKGCDDSSDIYCCLISNDKVEKYSKDYSWPLCRGSEGKPSVYGDNTYQSNGEDGLEPFLFYKTFSLKEEEVRYIEVAGSQYYDGTKIQLHYCNGNIAQKWETWPDRTIRAQGAKWLCMDAKDSLTIGKKVQGWTCHGGVNQKFLVGENDFTQTGLLRYMRIHASNTGTFIINQTGHALISVGKRNYNTKQCWATNSFSNWPSTDTNDTNDNGKTNNIKTNNNIEVDRNEDWSESIGNSTAYRKRDLSIDKRTYDEIKYMNGYYGWAKDFWGNTVNGYNITNYNCATFARDLWNKYTGEWTNFTGAHTPGAIYNSIWWYNEQQGPYSQCSKGY